MSSRLASGGRHGGTLIEMMIVVTMAGLTTVIGLPRAELVLEHTDVRAARTLVATMLDKAHYAAIARGGGATLTITRDGLAWVTAPKIGATGIDTLGKVENLHTRFGVGVQTPNATTQLTFDALGIGTAGSSTLITITGADMADSLTISASGRTAP